VFPDALQPSWNFIQCLFALRVITDANAMNLPIVALRYLMIFWIARCVPYVYTSAIDVGKLKVNT